MTKPRPSIPATSVALSRHEVVNDLTIGVRTFGSAHPDPLVFVLVHGIGVSYRYWEPLARELAARGTVYLLDLPGYGTAPNPHRDVSVTDHADVVAEFVRKEGLAAPVLVGHSMGSQIVSEAAVRHPTLTDLVVLLGPTLSPHTRTLLRSAVRLGIDMLREPPRANWIVMTGYLFRCGPLWYLAQLPHLLRDRMEDRMPAVGAEALVIRGNRDAVVSAAWGRSLAVLAPRGRFAEVPGPHVIMFTAPKQIAVLIVEHARG